MDGEQQSTIGALRRRPSHIRAARRNDLKQRRG